MATKTPHGHILAHDDHNLLPEHIDLIDEALRGWSGSYVRHLIEIPEHIPALESLLRGPCAGDDVILDDDKLVVWEQRANRPGKSKLVHMPPLTARKMVVVAGPGRMGPLIYTAYGSPLIAPMEPFDKNLSEKERSWAIGFWSVHALAKK